MLVSTQLVSHLAAAPILAATGFHGEGCRIGHRCAAGSVSLVRAISIAEATAGRVQEASHSQ
jgi:hypothetical protein